MRSALVAAAWLAIASPVLAFQAQPAPVQTPAPPPAPTPSETIRYGEAPSQIIEVFLPPEPAAGPQPVVVFIHGGCYVSTDASLQGMRRTYADLAKRGVVVWGVGYRRTDETGGAFPGLFQDIGAATDRVRAEAERLHLDLNRVVVAGHSAGGHLALWEAGRVNLAPTSPLYSADPLRPRAVVAIAGPADLAPLKDLFGDACGPEVFDRLVGTASPERPDVYADTSPVDLVPLALPTWLFVGSKDDVVPPPFVEAYAEAARAAGDTVTVRVIDDADHIDVVRSRHPAWAEIADRLAAAAKGD